MKIAIPLTGGRVSAHFGHCEQFALIETDAGGSITGQSLVTPPPHEPGLLPRWLKGQAVTHVVAGGMGRRALDLFAQNDIIVHAGAPGDTPEAVTQAFLKGALGNAAPACGHHGHSHSCGH